MNTFLKPALLLFLAGSLLSVHSQTNHWILGEWKGTGITPGSAYGKVFVRILVVTAINNKNQFTGKLIQQLMSNTGIRIEKELRGLITKNDIKINTGRTLYVKQPANGFWADCSACKMNSTRISVSSDSLILTTEIRGCGGYCDGYSNYYKSLGGYDTATQRNLVQLFGSPLLVKIFQPVPPDNSLPGGGSNQRAEQDTIQQQLSRKNKTIATYNVADPVIKIELFDNGEIDGDMVTVYHNKQKIIDRQVLGLEPIRYTVTASAGDRIHEFTLVANNLGRVPPNTALMRITAGSNTYELFPKTTLEENASVIIVYSGDK